MRPLKGNQTYVSVEGQEILTLRDILPAVPGLLALFVAKTPAPPGAAQICCAIHADGYVERLREGWE
jgi:hypothetical protein